MKRQVLAGILAGAVTLVILVVVVARTSPIAAVGAGAAGGVGLAFFGWRSLRRSPHRPWSEARHNLGPQHAVIFWKPGCPYCERLLRGLRSDDRCTWVNVWYDRDANERVCALNEGNEYTPTALVGSQVLRNPTAAEVRATLG